MCQALTVLGIELKTTACPILPTVPDKFKST